MKSKVLKLCKRLNKVTIDEITPILQATRGEICPVLDELVAEGRLELRSDGTYFYKEVEVKKTNLPLFFEYHSSEEIDLIAKCFCANIEVSKVMNLTGLSKNCIDKFYKYFRELIYKKQLNELNQYFIDNPKIGREREYMGKYYYLYLYNDQLFVSQKLLKNDRMMETTNQERLKIKNIYLRASRKVLNFSYSHFYYLHLAEELWRMDKDFSTLHDIGRASCR